MKYGDKLYRCKWYFINSRQELLAFRYRIDPVPFIHKRSSRGFGNWYKTPRVMNEKRQSFTKFCRAKRNLRNLPNPWDDYPRADSYDRRSWKKNWKCRKQYMVNVGK